MGGHTEIPVEVQRRMAEAKAALRAAEAELESAMRKVQLADRADKRIISDVLQAAFDKVTAARVKLEAVLLDE
jgi:hypothetical protein